MFRKIVSNLAFSPALVGQLGFYAKRLKKEEATRRLGLVFTALALVVQSLTVFTPPESANAANGSDMIYGGVSTKKAILDEYDKHRSDFKDIMDYNGITRAELANLTDSSINSKGQGTGEGSWKTWGRAKRFSPAQGEVKHVIPLDTGGATTIYSRPLWLFDSTPYTIPNGSTYDAFIGHSAKRGLFAIMKDCGNLVTKTTPKPDVSAQFIAASCSMIKGKATDGRDKDARLKVFLYYGGPPGKGEKSEAITTDADHHFAVAVPEKYKKKADSTKVWGVMIPLAGWEDSTVQFENTVTIPGGCIKPEPAAKCEQLSFERISRTEFKLRGEAIAENGAKIKNYRFTVTDSSNKTVLTKDVPSTDTKASSGKLTITEPGSYTARVVVKTSLGDKTNQNCTASFKVTAALTPAIDIVKKVDSTDVKEVGINAEFTYDLIVTNTGDVTLKNVLVSDTAPAGITFLSSNVTLIKNNKFSYTIPELKPGQGLAFTIKAKVTKYVAGSLVNTACVNAAEVNPGQPTQTDDCDDAAVTVESPTEMIQVCDLQTLTIITIEASTFDSTKHSRDLTDCQKPCTTDTAECVQVTESKTSKNLTQDVDATTMKAQAGDRIEFTIYLENIGTAITTRTVSEELSDVLEYSQLTQNGGGTYNADSKVLSWSSVTLKPGEKTSRSFVVQVSADSLTMARGASEPTSYDCIMTNAFGNTVNVPVACDAPKIVETTVAELPKTGPSENILFAGIVATVVTFFWARSRQLAHEVRLIRKDFNMGTI